MNNNGKLMRTLDNFIDGLLINENSVCNISIYIDNKESEIAIFKNADYFITNRSMSTIIHSEYAYENSVKIISGVDIPIF